MVVGFALGRRLWCHSSERWARELKTAGLGVRSKMELVILMKREEANPQTSTSLKDLKKKTHNCPILFCKILERFVLWKWQENSSTCTSVLRPFLQTWTQGTLLHVGWVFFFIHPSTEKLTQNCIFLPSGNLKWLQIPSECTGLLSCPSSGLL